MRWIKLAWKNIIYRPLGSILSILLLSFATALIVMLINSSNQFEQHFQDNIRNIDLVVGAKGSPLGLILSSVYHIDDPTGNIPLEEYEKLRKHPMVKTAIPLSFGDNYKGYRIVGTNRDYPELFQLVLKEGKFWKGSKEVTLGARVAALTGLKINDTFHSRHGLHEEAHAHEEHPFRVVGILEESGSVVDQLILTSTESIWDVHEDSGNKEITSALLQFKTPMAAFSLPRYINSQTSMQAAMPSIEINRLFSLFTNVRKALEILAYVIMLVSAFSVFISLIQSLKDRKYELALLRSMGAAPMQLFLLLLVESLIISLISFVLGWLLGKTLFLFISQLAFNDFQISWQLFIPGKAELILLAVVIFIGLIAGLIPSWRAYRLNISKTLGDA